MSDAVKKTTMPYVRLGKSGLKVSRIILGCMSYGTKSWQGWVLDEADGIKHIKAAFEAGINTFDTANIYSNGESERILGKAVKEIGAPRSSFVIMTKVYGLALPEGVSEDARKDPDSYGPALVNLRGLSRKHIFESVKASLERLQMDYVDVLQCHRFDPNTPYEETMQAMHDVVKAGYARYIGMSSCAAWQFHIMQNYAIANSLTPFISMQNYHSLLYREEEREMNPVCSHFGVGTIPWSPLSTGLLSRPRNHEKKSLRHETTGKTVAQFFKLDNDPNLAIIDRVEKIAKKKNVSMSQIALAWLMTKDPVAAPIVGTTKIENLMDVIKSVDVKLDEEEIKFLEETYTPKPIVGH